MAKPIRLYWCANPLHQEGEWHLEYVQPEGHRDGHYHVAGTLDEALRWYGYNVRTEDRIISRTVVDLDKP